MIYKLNQNYLILAALGAFVLLAGYGSATLAVAATPTPTDYAIDVQAGQAAIQSDPAVASNAKEVNDSESDEGDVDNEPAEVKEAVEPAEATEAPEASESSDGGGQDGSGEAKSGTTGGGR